MQRGGTHGDRLFKDPAKIGPSVRELDSGMPTVTSVITITEYLRKDSPLGEFEFLAPLASKLPRSCDLAIRHGLTRS